MTPHGTGFVAPLANNPCQVTSSQFVVVTHNFSAERETGKVAWLCAHSGSKQSARGARAARACVRCTHGHPNRFVFLPPSKVDSVWRVGNPQATTCSKKEDNPKKVLVSSSNEVFSSVRH